MTSTMLPAFLAIAAFAAPALADSDLSVQPLSIDISAALEPDPPPTAPTAPAATDPGTDTKTQPAHPTYGHAGAQAWTIGGLYANDFHQSNDLNFHVAYSVFLADDFEFAVEAAVWYFDQPGTDTFGVSGSMVFRWHFLHDADYNWTIFGDAGIGILGAFDEVPDGGTSFDFLPRLGGGFTKRLGDDADSPRLMLGVRWHHVSNARIEGDSRNPGRDGLALYAAIVIPF